MLKLEALDRNTVRNIRIVDETAYAEASIDWPAFYSTEGPGQPAIEIRVEASASITEGDTASAVEIACEKAVAMLVAAFQARFPEKRLLTVAEVLKETVAKPPVPSDLDGKNEGDPQAIWDNRLMHLGADDRARVDYLERRLVEWTAGRCLKRQLRGGVGWRIDGSDLISVDLALACRTDEGFGMIVLDYAGRSA